jgi:LPS export ABC transporter protein LptC
MWSKKTLISVMFLFCFCLAGCSKDKNIEEVSSKEQDAQNIFEKFTLSEFKKGIKVWSLDAEYAYMYENKNLIFITEPVVFFYENKKVASKLVAEKAKVFMDTKNINFKGETTGYSFVNETLIKTNEVFYDNSKNEVSSDNKVIIEKKDAIITGTGFVSDPMMKELVIKKDINIKKKEGLI